eukprot:scaffold245477_cov20-Cyclotella_meneghiniana.AAC.1
MVRGLKTHRSRDPEPSLVGPLDVAGLGAKYFRIKSAFMNGIPSNWPLLIALINVCAGGLKNA